MVLNWPTSNYILITFASSIEKTAKRIIYRVAKGFSLKRDGTQIISVTRDRAQISRVTRGWAYQRDA